MSFFDQLEQSAQRVKESRDNTSNDFGNTGNAIAELPCNDGTAQQILAYLSRWNNPGTGMEMNIHRFIGQYNLALPTPGVGNHPTLALFRTIKSMVTGSDRVKIKTGHWNEITIDPRWRSPPSTRLLPEDPAAAARARPLYKALKKCRVGQSRSRMGGNAIYEFFMFDAVLNAVNGILAASGESVTMSEVEYIVGKKQSLARPMRQMSIKWNPLATPNSRRAAVWTLAASCSVWGMEFVDSFMDFCSAALVGPVCGVTRAECKEGFAACVAVATASRARRDRPITGEELTACTRAMWVLDVIERACTTANGTLWATRTISDVKGNRVPVKACDKWETPIDPALQPTHALSVTGPDCTHPQNANPDGTFGQACAGRWVVVTKIEDLAEEKLQDGNMRVTLTHANAPAVNNVLATLEHRGRWAYVQGPNECLSCAYTRSLRFGFPVLVDGPESPIVPSVVHCNKRTFSFGWKSSVWSLPFLVLAYLTVQVVAQSTTDPNTYPLERNVFKPNASCEHFSGLPKRTVISWAALVGILRGAQSVILTGAGVYSGKRFVRRTPFNLITCIVTTLVAGLSGWINSPGCASLKFAGLLKGLITAAVNRLSFEGVDVLCMALSFPGVTFPIISFCLTHNFLALVQPTQLALICLSASYAWRWLDTARNQSISRGVVGSPIPLLTSHILALVFTVLSFVYNAKKDSTSGVASYVSDGLLMAEVLFQYILLV